MVRAKARVSVEPLDEKDVEEAGRICRLAFGTFLGLPDPMKVFGDKEPLANRWRASPDKVLGAYIDGELVGSNVLSRWGTFGWFGPLTIRPDLWDKGVAQALLGPTTELFSSWGTTHQGLFTFPNSPKHLGLYSKFGFNARFLTPVMGKRVTGGGTKRFQTFSGLGSKERARTLGEIRELTDMLYPGLDLTDEIAAVDTMRLGDVVITSRSSRVEGFAVCHAGANTEGGTGNCYVKFGAVLPGRSAGERFRSLVSAVEGYAAHRRLATLEAGVNMARRGACRELIGAGFRSQFVGVAMQRPDQDGFNTQRVFAIDDWR